MFLIVTTFHCCRIVTVCLIVADSSHSCSEHFPQSFSKITNHFWKHLILFYKLASRVCLPHCPSPTVNLWSKARFDCNIPLESVSGIHTHNSGWLTYSCSLHIYFITGLSPCIVLSCTVMKPLDIRKCYYLCFHPGICNIVHNH